MLYKQLALSPLEESEAPIGISLDDILKKIQIQWEKNIEENHAKTGIFLHAKVSMKQAKISCKNELQIPLGQLNIIVIQYKVFEFCRILQ